MALYSCQANIVLVTILVADLGMPFAREPNCSSSRFSREYYWNNLLLSSAYGEGTKVYVSRLSEYDCVGSGSNNVAYTGLQPHPDNSTIPVLHANFSSFMPGTTTTDANCHSGADNGAGVSCSVEWNSAFTREYNFEVKTTGNRVWVGTVIDGVTGQRIHIGSFTLPAGAQGIQSSQAGFIEWFPWNGYEPPNHCALLPYQQTDFGDPTTTHAGSVGKQSLGYEYGDCVGQVGFYTQSITGGVAEACGFVGQKGS